MKYFSIIVLLCVIYQCSKENIPKAIRTETKILNQEIIKPIFPEYVFSPKDTIFRTIEYGIKTQTIELGLYSTDSVKYSILREFRLIPGMESDSPRGRSTLYLLAESGDTLIYNAEMPDELPIDIYKNHLVFINEKGLYEFATISHLEEHFLCFSDAHNICFM